MGFHVFDDSQNAAGWLLSIIFTPICIIATVLRFVATKRNGRKLGWEDFWALLGLVFFLPYVVYMLMLFSKANGRTALQYIAQEPKHWRTMAPFGIMMNGLYGLQQTSVKYSLLALYHRVFWINRGFVIMVWIVAVIQGMWGVVVLLCHIFACTPIRKSWNPRLSGTCIDVDIFFSIYEPINSAIDLVMAGMAIFMLWKLSFRRNTKKVWGFSILFALGALSGVLGIVKTVEAQNSAKRNYLSIIWNLVQMATSIICCCAPIYRSIIPEINMFSSIGSWASRTFQSKSSRSKLPDDGSDKDNKRTESRSRYDPPWMQQNKSSERELVRVEIDLDPGHGKLEAENGR